MIVLRKSTCVIELWGELGTFLMDYHFYGKEWMSCTLGRHFLESEWSDPATSEEMTASVGCQWWNWNWQAKIIILENLYWSLEYDNFLVIKGFGGEISNDNCGIFFWILYDEMCPHLEDLQNLVKRFIFRWRKHEGTKICTDKKIHWKYH